MHPNITRFFNAIKYSCYCIQQLFFFFLLQSNIQILNCSQIFKLFVAIKYSNFLLQSNIHIFTHILNQMVILYCNKIFTFFTAIRYYICLLKSNIQMFYRNLIFRCFLTQNKHNKFREMSVNFNTDK